MRTTKKLIYLILCLTITSFANIEAKTNTHKSPKHKTHIVKKKAGKKKHVKKHKKVDTRPILTHEDVKNQDDLWGIDISHHQAYIDWSELKEEKPNFMFIKASEGVNIQDSKYGAYYQEAKKLGIPVGSYHFFSYKSSGKEQAENFLSVAKHSNGDLLPVLDAEFTHSTPKKDKEKVTSELTDFINTIYEKLGKYPIIYCNYHYCQTFLTAEIQKKCLLWIVDYFKKPDGNWALWQATNKLKLNAIKGHVDLNYLNSNAIELKSILFKEKEK